MIALFLAEGFEEVEALTPLDLLRRAGADVRAVSVDGSPVVTGSHGIGVRADLRIEEVGAAALEGVILPGGMPGAQHLCDSAAVRALTLACHRAGRLVAAICAAPAVALLPFGVLDGRKATGYPAYAEELGGRYQDTDVAVDGHVITSRGVGTAIPFALGIIAHLYGDERASQIAEEIVFRA